MAMQGQVENLKSKYGEFVLHEVLGDDEYNCNVKLVTALIDSDLSLLDKLDTRKDGNDRPAIQQAFRCNAADKIILYMLEKNPDVANQKNKYSWTSVHTAAYSGNAALLKKLLEMNSDAACEKNDDGNLPLSVAVKNVATEEIVTILLEAYPEATRSKNNDGKVPVQVAAAAGASAGVIKTLLQAHPKSAELSDKDGNTLLHLAAMGCKTREAVAVVLQACPEAVKTKNGKGSLPLHRAASGKSPEVIELLAQAYPEGLKEKSKTGNVPFHTAAYTSAPIEVCAAVLKAWPEAASAKDNDGDTVLLWTCSKQGSVASEVLVALCVVADEKCATVRSKNGNLPLQCAAWNKDKIADVKFALLKEAYPKAVNSLGSDFTTVWSRIPDAMSTHLRSQL